MPDFCLVKLRELLAAFQREDFRFLRFEDHWEGRSADKTVLLRHDVDRFPETALATAQVESKLGIRGTYFFRLKPWVLDERIVREIHGLGHEIGYHYECLSDSRGDMREAVRLVKQDLETLRRLVPVVSAAMHGRPLSKHDNRIIWKQYSLSDFGLRGEAYLSIDHNEFLYFSDTGRDWNPGRRASIWDRVEGREPPLIMNGTNGLIEIVPRLSKVQLLIHPNRWPLTRRGWAMQWAADQVLNGVKRLVPR